MDSPRTPLELVMELVLRTGVFGPYPFFFGNQLWGPFTPPRSRGQPDRAIRLGGEPFYQEGPQYAYELEYAREAFRN